MTSQHDPSSKRQDGLMSLKSIGEQLAQDQRQFEEEFQQRQSEHRRQKRKDKKALLWIARLGSVPLGIIAIGNLVHLGVALSGGRIKEISRYGSRIVFLEQQPNEYWMSVVFHLVLAVFLFGATYICLRATGWFKKYGL